MITAERKKVLEMLAQGKISPEDAERLLDKLADSREGEEEVQAEGGATASRPQKLRYLRVLVNDTDNERINIRLPLALVRTGIKFSAMVPSQVNEALGEQGVDLSHLSSLDEDELIEALRDLDVEIGSGEGEVRIFCE